MAGTLRKIERRSQWQDVGQDCPGSGVLEDTVTVGGREENMHYGSALGLRLVFGRFGLETLLSFSLHAHRDFLLSVHGTFCIA